MAEKNPREILNTWIQSINKFNIDKVLSLYEAGAVIIPTFSDTILNNPGRIRSYFERLGRRRALEIAVHEKTVNTQFLENGKSIIYGIYIWKFMVDDELMSYEARFSFLLDLEKSSPIIHHHSSAIPRII
jgi:hypothetical protein